MKTQCEHELKHIGNGYSHCSKCDGHFFEQEPRTSNQERVIETSAEIAERAVVVADDEWTRFDDHFFHGCCQCGLSHTVTLRRVGDQHEIRWERNESLTAESRARHDHPLWQEISESRELRTVGEWVQAASTHEPPAEQWRCFHCDEVCTDRASALEHFGTDRHCDPICKVDRAEYRRMEKRNIEHTLEDTQLHRALHAKDAEMQTKVRQAEETGYARGLEDAKKHPEELGLARASQPPAHDLRRYVHEQLGHLCDDDNRPAEGLIRIAAERTAPPPGVDGLDNVRDPDAAARELLQSYFWLKTLKPNTRYVRLQDDHDGEYRGTLSVTIGEDGDAWVSLDEANARFRMPGFGGGASQYTRTALVILAEAIRRDNAEHPRRSAPTKESEHG